MRQGLFSIPCLLMSKRGGIGSESDYFFRCYSLDFNDLVWLDLKRQADSRQGVLDGFE
jgi:hypothetical protein